MAGTLPDELLLARIRKEATAREAAVNALYAALDAATAEMQQKITVAASKLSSTINGRTVNASAIAGTILRTQVEPGFAMAEELTLLEARVTDNETTSIATIEEVRRVTATLYESTADQILTIRAQFNGNVAYLQEQITATSNATSAVASRTTTLESTVNNATTGVAATSARLTTEETTRATADTALSSRTTTLESTVNNATTGVAATSARLTTEETTRANADTALSARTTTLESTVNDPTDGNLALRARITTEETTRANADTALSNSISTVSATASGKNKTFYQSSAPTASATGDLWVDTTSNLNSVKRWNGSAWVDTQVAAGAIGAAVSAESSARATADGFLSGKYALKVIAGGIVTGMNITSSTGGGTDVSDVTFQGDNFKIHNGSSGVVPFSVNTVTNVVRLTNVVVDTLAASIQITSPTILGATLKFSGASTICCDTSDGSDTGILRMNGGGADSRNRGGQVDVIGNEYTTVPGFAGSILITPGDAATGAVRIRDRYGNDRISVDDSGEIFLEGLVGTDVRLKDKKISFCDSGGIERFWIQENWGAAMGRYSDMHHIHTSGTAFVVGNVLAGTPLTGNRIYFGDSDVYLHRVGDELWINDANGNRALS